MIHTVFNRTAASFKPFDAAGHVWKQMVAGGDAWGNYGVSDDDTPPAPPYGHACWCPEGHFMLGAPQVFDTPIASEGYGQIPVYDLDADTLAKLVQAGKAEVDGDLASIGGLVAKIGQLAAYGRQAIMIHCGGSNAPDPLAPNQGLYRTFGCTRMLNADWQEYAAWLAPQVDGNTLVYTAIGDPLALAA